MYGIACLGLRLVALHEVDVCTSARINATTRINHARAKRGTKLSPSIGFVDPGPKLRHAYQLLILMEPQWLREGRRDYDVRNLRNLGNALRCRHGTRMDGHRFLGASILVGVLETRVYEREVTKVRVELHFTRQLVGEGGRRE